MTHPEPSHPEELLPFYVNGTLAEEERLHVEEHLRSCLTCRREVEELRELRREVKTASAASPPGAAGLERLLAAVEAEPSAAPDRSRPWRLPWVPLAVAALLAVAVGIFLWPSKDGQEPPGTERAGEEIAVLRSLVAPDEPLPRDGFVLRWATAPEWEEARFAVTVTAEDLTPLAAARGLETTQYEVPAEALAALPSGARLFWRVEAARPDGARHTELFEVRLE